MGVKESEIPISATVNVLKTMIMECKQNLIQTTFRTDVGGLVNVTENAKNHERLTCSASEGRTLLKLCPEREDMVDDNMGDVTKSSTCPAPYGIFVMLDENGKYKVVTDKSQKSWKM